VHIDDVVEAYVASLDYDHSGYEAFNIASGKSHSIEQIVRICEYSFVNSVQFLNLDERRQNEILDIETNINKAKSKLKWEPKISFEEGMSNLIELFNRDPKLRYFPSEDQKTYKLKTDIIPLSVPSFKGNEWDYVKKCLDTEWVSTAGKFVDDFEEQASEFTKSKYAVACISGTAALHISLLIAGVLPEDEVIVPTLTFIAPINAVRYCNAYPVFMDSDQYYNIDISKTLDFILNETEIKTATIDGVKSEFSFNKKTGRRVSAIIPVHIFGNAVWLDDLIDICKKGNIRVIEDATESLGTQYNSGKFTGKLTGTIGDMGCLSFNGNKIITTGGGGMILTNNQKYAKKAYYLTTQAKDDKVRFIHNSIGYNYRLTNLQSALGCAQLQRLPEYLRIKKDNYSYYKNYIDNIDGLHLAETPGYADSNYWMYALQIDKEKYGREREELMYYLSKRKIQTRPIWYLNHKQAAYKQFQTYKIKQAQILLNNTLNIPCSVNLNKYNIDKVIASLNER
jgi:aminotransferase in exopolysaccharide biosynthesis